MPGLRDVPLPKHVSDSCYAEIIQIYKDMFDLTPKSNLIHYLVNFSKHQTNGSIDSNTSQKQQQKNSKFLSFGSFKKTSSVNNNNNKTKTEPYNDVLHELTDSKDFKRPKRTGNKSDVRASWHGETTSSRRKQYDTHL